MNGSMRGLTCGALVLGLLVTSGGCGSSGASNSKRIILLTNGNSPYWTAARHGLTAADKDLKLSERGLRAVMETNDGTPQGQIDKLRQYASQSDVAAVGVSVVDATNATIAEEMAKLRAKGIHVLAIDNDVDRSRFRDARYAFIGTDNRQAGRELGKAIHSLVPDGGEIATFVGRTGAQNASERVEGILEGAEDSFTLVANLGDDFDRGKAADNVRNTLTNFPKVKLLAGIYSYNGPAICKVLKERERKDVKAVTFDAEPISQQDMADGTLDVMLLQNPYQIGYQAVRMMDALVEKNDAVAKELFPRFGDPDGDIHTIGLKVVVPDQGSPLKKALFDERTEFMTLSELKAWMAKYGLSES